METTNTTLASVPRTVVFRAAGLGWNPLEHIDQIWADIDRLIKAVVYGHTDNSNINMHTDELCAELRLKLAQLLERDDLFFESRTKFFGFLKVAFVRHVKSLTQRYVYTFKRTGVDRTHSRNTDQQGEPAEDVAFESEKRHTLSLDDDEQGAENFVGANDIGLDESSIRDEFLAFVRDNLTAQEASVVFQEYEPNDAALQLALQESKRNLRSRRFKLLDRHKAEGLGMPTYVYKRILLRVRTKFEKRWKRGNA